jgi:hypothetical protein
MTSVRASGRRLTLPSPRPGRVFVRPSGHRWAVVPETEATHVVFVPGPRGPVVRPVG